MFWGVHQHTTCVNCVIFYMRLGFVVMVMSLQFHSTCDFNICVFFFLLFFHTAALLQRQTTETWNQHVGKCRNEHLFEMKYLRKGELLIGLDFQTRIQRKNPFHCPTNTPVTLYVLHCHIKVYCHITLMLHSTFTVPQLLQRQPTNRADDHPASLSSKVFIHSCNGIILWPSFQWVLEWIIKQNSLQFFHRPST